MTSTNILFNKNMGKKFKKVGSIAVWVLIALILFLNIYNLIDRMTGFGASLFGFRPSVIVSNSMSFIHDANKDYLEDRDDLHRIYKNDMIFTMDTSYDDLNIYDVVTYYSDGSLICHRIVDKYESDGKKYVVTRGDANNTSDAPFEESMLRGKVIGVWSGVGVVFLFFQSLYGLLAVFVCMFFIFLGMFISQKEDKSKDKKKEKTVVDAPVEVDQSAKEVEDDKLESMLREDPDNVGERHDENENMG